MSGDEWFPHKREDGETVGYVVAAGELWQALDILGRPVAGPGEWVEAEDALEARGLAMLVEPHTLVDGGHQRRVRIVEVTREWVTVVDDELGAAQAIGGDHETFTLPVPVGDRLV
ncbi:hypothetical protein [Nocardioides jensenii]|uniref:hypothetical protein n=1 Tax=Nocardioides jensenii TaxID=1843 RepID=UPI0008295614|nr:hypothetical protein [Nocardioides jensenii]